MNTLYKRCADTLRVFCENQDIKLKASHAHEIIAAFFGYKSKAAMDTDNTCSMDNLSQANIYVLTPSALIDTRRESLEGLPPDLPDTDTLSEALILVIGEAFRGRIFASFANLTEVLASEYLQSYGTPLIPAHFGRSKSASQIFSKPIFEFNPKIQNTKDGVRVTATNRYYGSVDLHFPSVDILMSITLQRIAGHVGYRSLDVTGEVCSVERQSA